MITVLGAVVVLAVLAVARYGADSRFDSGPDPRDPARPRGPQYAHTPAADLALLVTLGRRVAAHRRAWQAYDRGLRPWERDTVRPRGRVEVPAQSSGPARSDSQPSRSTRRR